MGAVEGLVLEWVVGLGAQRVTACAQALGGGGGCHVAGNSSGSRAADADQMGSERTQLCVGVGTALKGLVGWSRVWIRSSL